MSKVKIETLTPVHVGSGNLLYNKSDFITEKSSGNDTTIVVISPDKIGKLMSDDKVENFIKLWVQTIENRGDLKEFIEEFAPNASSDDYSKRKITLSSLATPDDTLKECIHNGMGLPYIPGSSIKGAIRTAVLASLTNEIYNIESKIIEKTKDKITGEMIPKRDKKGNIIVTSKYIEKELFGSDPNHDVFRFVQVGDAYFEKRTEIATRLINLNIRNSNNDLTDTSKSQLIEAIRQEANSEFQLNFTEKHYQLAKEKVGEMPFSSQSNLFSLINKHTKKMVEKEIEDWENVKKTGAESYINEMRKILEAINGCKEETSCVLRLGHASGWHFITGAWTKTLDNFKTVVVPASRPGNENYKKYDFPKTRRLDEDSHILGFVKLTII